MTERIDHVAKAQEWLQSESYERAQVHATLAVAEHQRIANLLAMTAISFRDADFTKQWNAEGDTEEWRKVRDEVAEALGLT